MIEYKNIIWQKYQGSLIPKIPPHKEINLTKIESSELLSISKAYLLRYTNEWDRDGGEFWYVIKDKFVSMEEMSRKCRTQIRKGLNNCLVNKVDNEVIAKYGYEVYINAFKKYNTPMKPISKEDFTESALNSGYDSWAVFTKDDSNLMIAYMQLRVQDNICNRITSKFHPSYLKLRPSEALNFEIDKYYLKEKGSLYINNGARTISHDTNIQDYLIRKFKYRKAYCRLNVKYRKDIMLIANMLYPFREIISNINLDFASSIKTLLKQEEIRRSYDE